jgi:hypothetical protein
MFNIRHLFYSSPGLLGCDAVFWKDTIVSGVQTVFIFRAKGNDFTLKIMAARSSEILVFYHNTTRLHNIEYFDFNLRRENLRSRILMC